MYIADKLKAREILEIFYVFPPSTISKYSIFTQ